MGLFENGYAAFHTDERQFNDGSQQCDATLYVTDIHGGTMQFTGSSTKGKGHAEMTALFAFLESIKWDVAEYRTYTVEIECLNKPCCKFCAAVMGSIGITPRPNTFKSAKSMGISYNMTMQMRKFLGAYLGVTQQVIVEEFTG
jgi:hypothetical protein